MDQDTVRIPLRARDGSIRAYALIDAADADWVNQWRWHVDGGYAARADRSDGRQRQIRLHRELLGLVPGDGLEGDHLSRDKLDCRRVNLRIVPRKGRPNAQNSSSRRGTSIYRGVSWHERTGMWRAYVTVASQYRHIGLFGDEQDAAEAAREARLRLMPYALD